MSKFQKVDRLEEGYVEEEVSYNLYSRFWTKYREEKQEWIRIIKMHKTTIITIFK